MQILDQLAEFKTYTQSAIKQLDATTDVEAYYAGLFKCNQSLNRLALAIGTAYEAMPLEDIDQADLSQLVVHYKLCNTLKSYLICEKCFF